MTAIALLIHRYLKEELTEPERLELEAWIAVSEGNRRIFDQLTHDDHLSKAVENAYRIDTDAVALQKMNARIDGAPARSVIRSWWPKMAAAAAILVVVSLTVFYIVKKDREPVAVVDNTPVTPGIVPGANRATLTLADGRTIVLDTANTGTLAQEGGMQVMNRNGELAYAATGAQHGKDEVLWNTLSTANGQTYPVILSDHSRVWLNSGSSIRFPVAFTGNERRVEITGEAFFEVTHDAANPFRAIVNGVTIEVLGTKFNVNAYKDEDAIRTTLLEGKVKVSATPPGTSNPKPVTLIPGQQAIASAHSPLTIDHSPNLGKITAWKEGYFRFKADKLSEAMKNIARWYNIEVVFEGQAAHVEISGNIHRSSGLPEVIQLLSVIDVDARIEGRRLILTTR